jgi:hypothetical protein
MNNLELLKVYHFDKKIRCGVNSDGGYVIGELDGGYDCYISAGISNEESFSKDFINKYSMNEYNSFGFDGTIHNYPYHYTTKISFIKKNINSFNDDHHSNLSFLINKYDSIFLKIDIEGGEYPWLLSTSEEQLNKFKQIVIEFHGITNDGWNCDYMGKVKCLEKLSKTHYIIHAHGNNHGPVCNKIPDVIELTYVNKNYFNSLPELNKRSLPIVNIDFPNNSHSNDIDLNFYPFVTCNMENIFTTIYENKIWGSNQNNSYNGSSGVGSSIEYNKDTYIPFLQKFIIDNNIKTIVDLGCGDFRCGNLIYDELDILYTGYDAYNKVIEHNSAQQLLPKYNFLHLDFCNSKETIINGELCILKDVIQHWNLSTIYKFLDYLIESKKFKYILIINCCYQTQDNTDIPTGGCRPLSSDYFPLKKYSSIKIYNYDTKEISVITTSAINL